MRDGERENKNEGEGSVCRLLQSHCTTLEFQTRTLGRAESRAESRGVEREERQRQQGERASSKLTLEANRRQARGAVINEIS